MYETGFLKDRGKKKISRLLECRKKAGNNEIYPDKNPGVKGIDVFKDSSKNI
jgi:hypothetical protein